MTTQTIEVITIYSASQTSGARTRRRLLGLLSLVVAAAWIWGTYEKANPWIENKVLLKGVAELFTVGALTPVQNSSLTPAQRAEQQAEFAAQAALSTRQAAVVTAASYIWVTCAYLAGGWLALAGLIGFVGLRVTRRLLRQAAFLMILSTLASIAGIWGVIKWGGMPPAADLPFYAKIGGLQSSYAWFLLLATRTLR